MMKKIILTAIAFAMFTPAWANYKLPLSIFDGYWAMTEPTQDIYHVIKFVKNDNGTIVAEQHKFECLSANKFSESFKMSPATLKPVKKGMLMNEESLGSWAVLSVVEIQPKKSLKLLQTYTDQMPQYQEYFPQGLTFDYVYTPVLRPNCH